MLKIPNNNRYLVRIMNMLTGSSGALILVIIVCFAFTIYSMLRHKKLSQMKSDFINNMTHEFKTPVSTIMLASEALKDEQMSAKKDQVLRSEEHTSELQSLMRISYAVFCLKKKNNRKKYSN